MGIDRSIEAAKQRVREELSVIRDDLLDLSHRVHANPEIAFQERQASAWTAELLQRHGFSVVRPFGGLETALEARWPGRSPGPVIVFPGEYDALPEIGHGCGHNTMCSSSAGAAIAVARALGHDFDGEVRFIGTPAEEAGNGKVYLINAGAFKDVSAALQIHPSDRTQTEIRTLAMTEIAVTFHGRAAHAAGDPWNGNNALDALVTLYNSVSQWRQHLRPGERVHGIITHGGAAPNIVPDETAARFYVRSTVDDRIEEMVARFQAMGDAAAMATGCTVTYRSLPEQRSRTMINSHTLGALWEANLTAAGWKLDEPDESPGSSDMANVSHEVPTIHPFMAVGPMNTPGHSREMAAYAAGPNGDKVVVDAAMILAQTAVDLLANPALVEQARDELRAVKAGAG